MEEIPHRLYPLFVKRKTWGTIYQFVNETDKVDLCLKPAWLEALDFMKEELGKGFFDTVDLFHPLDQLLGSGSAEEVKYLIRWVNTLKSIKENDQGYKVLLQKLISKNQCRPEGIPFMDIALNFEANGFRTGFLPERNLNGVKTPDISVTYLKTGEDCFIEVSQIRDSDDRKAKSNQYYQLQNLITFHGYDLPVAGELKRFMDESEFAKTVRDIQELKIRCWETQSLVSLENENVAIAFSTISSFPALEQWCNERNYSRGFNGLPVDFQDIPRIVDRGRIKLKAQQIPVTESGLLYFPSQAMFFMFTDIQQLIDAVLPVLAKEKHIFGVIFYAETIGSMKKDFYMNCGDFIYSISTDARHHVRETVFIENIAFSGRLSSEARWAFRKAIA